METYAKHLAVCARKSSIAIIQRLFETKSYVKVSVKRAAMMI
jgi:hypothetical protein